MNISTTDAHTPTAMTVLETEIKPEEYILGANDVLVLTISKNTNLSHVMTVTPDGKLFFPQGGSIYVAGKTITEAETMAKKLINEYYIGVDYSLSLQTPRNFLVHVSGEVKTPKFQIVNPISRVSNLIELSGGITESGSKRNITIEKDGKTTTVDLEQFWTKGKKDQNPTLSEGMSIHVPVISSEVTISGEVYKPGRFEILPNETLADVIERAGGIRGKASLTKPVKITRMDTEQNKKAYIETNLRTVLSDKTSSDNISLQNRDSIIISSVDDAQKLIIVRGAIMGSLKQNSTYDDQTISGGDSQEKSIAIPFDDNSKVTDALYKVGGVTPYAQLKKAYITRRITEADDTNKTKLDTIPVDLYEILINKNYENDLTLEPGDILTIPSETYTVFVTGEVKSPKSVSFNKNLSLMEYISMAGGPTTRAKMGSIVIIKPSGKKIDADDLDSIHMIEPGDTVFVPELLVKFWRDYVDIISALSAIVLSTFSIYYTVRELKK